MKKRLTALLLAFVMLLSVCCITAFANEGTPEEPIEVIGNGENETTEEPIDEEEKPAEPYFTDVAPGTWYYDAVQSAKEIGIMSGIGDGRFNPAGTTSRAMIVQIFYSMMGTPDVSEMTAPFTDIKEGSWYYDAVVWAYNAKIIAGMPDGTFHPTDSITREQFCVIAATFHYFFVEYQYDLIFDAEYAQKRKINDPETYAEGRSDLMAIYEDAYKRLLSDDFIDAAEVAPWALFEACCIYTTWGLTGAKTDEGRVFMPKKTLTRAEAATLIVRYYESFKEVFPIYNAKEAA